MSKFLTDQAERERKEKEKGATAEEEAPVDLEALAAAEAEELDELKGRRARVGRRPPRQAHARAAHIHRAVDGRIYTAEARPYYGVESLWNATNYWVNMKGPSVSAAKLDFDLADVKKWEPLLWDSTSAIPAGGDEAATTPAAAAAAAAATRWATTRRSAARAAERATRPSRRRSSSW